MSERYQLETDADDGVENPSVHSSEAAAVERLQERYDAGEPITTWAIVSIDEQTPPNVATARSGTARP